MKKKSIYILAFPLVLAACNYVGDRGNDAADIFTFTVGGGMGASANVGPLHAGLGAYQEWYGLRGGNVSQKGGLLSPIVAQTPSSCATEGMLKDASPANTPALTSFSPSNYVDEYGLNFDYTFGSHSVLTCARTWNKIYYSYDYPGHLNCGIPFVTVFKTPKGFPRANAVNAAWFDINVYAAGFFGFRTGINLAELTDFFIGFTTLDILDDDTIEIPEYQLDSTTSQTLTPRETL